MQSFDGFPWALATVLGVIILAAAIAYGMWVNTKRSAGDKRLTEAGTRREYEEEDRPDQRRPHIPT